MQASTQTQPAAAPSQAPAPPVTVTTPTVTITTVGPGGTPQTLTVPKTAEEVRELLVQREELSDQLSNVSSRRRELSEEIRVAPEGASRTGLEERLRVLDQRILQLETDLAVTGRQLSAAPAELVAGAESPNSGGNGDWEEGMFAGGFTVLFFVGLVYAYRRLRGRKVRRTTPVPMLSESGERLERLERGMEAIAIEIERVSEGQRFVTRLLSEQGPHGPSRIAQPLVVESKTPADR